jgi:hypothetical protein
MTHRNRLTALALTGGLLLGAAATAAAQEAAMPDASGTLVGDTGGAYQTWEVTLPASTDVSLTLMHWPCNTGKAIGLSVWGPSGKLASSWEKDACTQSASFNSGAGGNAQIQLYNYLHGVGTWWSLDAEGVALSGMAAPAAAAPMAAAVPAADTTTTTMAAAAPAAPAAPAPAGGASAVMAGGTVFGDSGGAYAEHNLAVEEGKNYTVEMTVGLDWGGTWPGVGFDVWGPGGHRIARGTWTDQDTVSASFTADGNVVYLIKVHNYHHGLTAFYSLDAKAAQ